MGYVDEESFGIVPLREFQGVWEVLLVLHVGGRHWAFPKGRANPGETALESAKRELQEETGLEVEKILQEQPLVEKYTFYRNKKKIVKVVHYFPAVVQGVLRLQAEEIREAKWVALSSAPAFLTFDESKNMCVQLIKDLQR